MNRVIAAFACALMVTPMFAACGDDVGVGDGGRLRTFPASQVSFSQVSLGGTQQKELVLTNQGSGNLTINDIRYEGGSDIILEFLLEDDSTNPPEDLVLEPGGEYPLVVTYSPTIEGGGVGGDIIIESNDSNNPEYTVQVVTQVLGPRIQVTPSRDQGLNFGQVDRGDERTETVSVTNVGPLPLEISEIVLNGNMAELQLVDVPDLPVTIADSSESIEFSVRYMPDTLGEDVGSVLIINNDPVDSNYELPIVANSSAPCIRVNPSFVEFTPAVAIGDVKAKQVTIESCGAVPLQISEIVRAPGGSQEILVEDAQFEKFAGITLEPGEADTLEILYAPTDETVDAAEFLVRSNDSLRPETKIEVLGTGTSNQCPVAEAKGRIAGSSVLEDSVAAVPLDTLVLDGTMSADPESSVEEWRWEITERPDGSTSEIEDQGDGLARLFIDLAGDYEICLNVIDAQGTESCDQDCITVRARPNEKIHVQLVWRTPEDPVVGDDDGTDVDIHFTRIPQGTWADQGGNGEDGWDVYFLNQAPTWNVPMAIPENPSLDIDDKDGEGPENVNLDDPNPCAWYSVGIHYFDDKGLGASFATVRVFINGQRRFEKINVPLEVGGVASGDFWEVALIHWDGSTARIFDRAERYTGDSWIGAAPTVPQSIQDQINAAVPECAE